MTNTNTGSRNAVLQALMGLALGETFNITFDPSKPDRTNALLAFDGSVLRFVGARSRQNLEGVARHKNWSGVGYTHPVRLISKEPDDLGELADALKVSAQSIHTDQPGPTRELKNPEDLKLLGEGTFFAKDCLVASAQKLGFDGQLEKWLARLKPEDENGDPSTILRRVIPNIFGTEHQVFMPVLFTMYRKCFEEMTGAQALAS